jgi:PKD repeat protein
MKVLTVSLFGWIILAMLLAGCVSQPPGPPLTRTITPTGTPAFPATTATPCMECQGTIPPPTPIASVSETPAVTASPAITPGKVLHPIADFTANPISGKAPLTVRFTDASTGAPTGWSWDFGDGNTSTGENPVHVYTEPGSYTVRLEASNSGGSNTETKSYYITVNPEAVPPDAAFAVNPPTAAQPTTVEFIDRSTGLPTSWDWNFGDGASSNLQNPVHTYPGNGTFIVTLMVSNSAGNSTVVGYLTFGTPAS